MPRAPGRLGFRGRFVHRRERQFHPEWPGALWRHGIGDRFIHRRQR